MDKFRKILSLMLTAALLCSLLLPVLAEETQEPSEAEAYSNYENDYDAQLQDFAETGEVEPEKKNDKLIIGLMITASVLCLGIIGILVYWLNAFLL